MLETSSKEIGSRGFTYHVTQLPSKKARNTLVRLVRIFGPVLGRLVEGYQGTKGKKATAAAVLDAVDGASVSSALSELAARLTEAELDHACTVFGEYTEISSDEDPESRKKLTTQAQELHFAGNTAELFEWLGFALEVNFSDFFKGSQIGAELGAALTGRASPKASSPSESRPG